MVDNGVYATTGGQPVPGSRQLDLAGFATAAGYPLVRVIADEASADAQLPELVRGASLAFVQLVVAPLVRRPPRPRRMEQSLHELRRFHTDS